MSAPWNPVPGWDVPRDYYAPDEPTADELCECDCCGQRRDLSRTDYCGIETWACDECRGIE